MAERQGFEPWELLRSTAFETAAINQTRPPLDIYVEESEGIEPSEVLPSTI